MRTEEKKQSIFGMLYSKVYVQAARMVKKVCLKSNRDFNFLFRIACDDFGTLQKKMEIKSLCDFVAKDNPSLICEIGSCKSGTSFLFANSFTSAEKLIFIDRTINNEDLLQYFNHGRGNLFFLEGDSCSSEVLDEIDRIIEDKSLDFLFIDGDHSFSGVKQDLLTYYGLVKDGGYIAFHDIVPDHSNLYNRPGGSWSGDVYKVWQRVKDLFESIEFVEAAGQDGFGIGVIRKNCAIDRVRLEEALSE